MLAPRLAPSDIVSNANVRTISAVVTPVHHPPTTSSSPAGPPVRPGMAFTGNGFRDGSVTAGGASRNPDQISWSFMHTEAVR